MVESTQPKVLACIDGSHYSSAVCDYAAWIARTVGAPLKLLHTLEQQPQPAVADFSGAIGLGSSEELLDDLTKLEAERSRLMLKKGKQMLKGAQVRANEAGVSDVHLCQRHGSLAESLVELEAQIRVLVVGIRGEQHADEDKGVGHHLESTIRSLHRPILVVNQHFTEPKTAMLAYDGSPAAQKALSMVANSPLFQYLPCHLVQVADKASDSLAIAEEELKKAGVDVTCKVLRGKSETVLPAYQAEQNIDLMLMGAFTHHRVRDLLWGSFTAQMLRKTQKPLLLLR